MTIAEHRLATQSKDRGKEREMGREKETGRGQWEGGRVVARWQEGGQ